MTFLNIVLQGWPSCWRRQVLMLPKDHSNKLNTQIWRNCIPMHSKTFLCILWQPVQLCVHRTWIVSHMPGRITLLNVLCFRRTSEEPPSILWFPQTLQCTRHVGIAQTIFKKTLFIYINLLLLIDNKFRYVPNHATILS